MKHAALRLVLAEASDSDLTEWYADNVQTLELFCGYGPAYRAISKLGDMIYREAHEPVRVKKREEMRG